MAAFNGYRQPEPFEEITAREETPDELEQYYEQLERAEHERRVSGKRASRWSRKHVDQQLDQLQRQRSRRELEAQRRREQSTPDASRPPSPDHDRSPPAAGPEPGPPVHMQRSWTAQAAAQPPPPPPAATSPGKHRYELYNSAGPRWYYNHHLNPPKQDLQAAAVFSTNFPAFASTPDGISSGPLGPRGLSFDSVPSTSQLGSADGSRFPSGNPRRNSPTSPPDEQHRSGIPRNQSTPSNLNKMTPSPLSKSVTALSVPAAAEASSSQYLQDPHMGRRLSKRNSKIGAIGRMFGRSVDDVSQNLPQQLAPSTATLTQVQTMDGNPNRPRPVSMAVPPSNPPTKRLSVFGKLAKKLSLAKHTPEPMIVERRPRPQQQPSGSSTNLAVNGNGHPAGAPQRPSPSPSTSEATPSSSFGPSSSSQFLSSFSSSSPGPSGSTPPTTELASRTPSPAKPEAPPETHTPDDRPTLTVTTSQSQKHSGAFVLSPPSDDDEESAHAFKARSDYPEPPESDGRVSPDNFHASIGYLMITNPDGYGSASEYTSDTPRALTSPLPPLVPPLPRFAYPESEAATGSSTSLKLQVINPSTPTTTVADIDELERAMERTWAPSETTFLPTPAAQPVMLPPAPPPASSSPPKKAARPVSQLPPGAAAPRHGRRERSPPKPSDHAGSPHSHSHSRPTQSPTVTSAPTFMTSQTLPDISPALPPKTSARRSPERDGTPDHVRHRSSPMHSSPERQSQTPTGSPTRREASRSTTNDRPSSKSERRVSRKPAPSVVPPSHRDQSPPMMSQATSSTSLQSTSTASLRTNSESGANVLSQYMSGAPSPPGGGDRREYVTKDGRQWQVTPLEPSAEVEVEDDGRGMKRSTSRVAMLNAADVFGAGPPSGARARTQSRPERHTNGSTSPSAPSPPPKPERDTRRTLRKEKALPAPGVPSKISSQRPVSEVHDDAGVGAREAFNLERMRKGMSVVSGGGANGAAWDRDLPAPPVPSRDPSSFGDPAPRRQPSLGSGHTNFVMQPAIATRPTY